MRVVRPLVIALSAVLAIHLTACGDKDNAAQSSAAAADTAAAQALKIGVCPGPYGKMVEVALIPELKEQGYEVSIVEFTDYVQPNLALESGDIDANLMQHTAYLENLVKTQGAKIQAVTNVPTLGMGVFSSKVPNLDFNSEETIKALKGGNVGVPTDAVNLARSLRLCRDLGLITLKAELDDNKASIADIDQNPYELEFVPMEAAQIPRSLDSLTLACVPGNYAYAAKLDFSQALGIEDVAEDIKNVVAVRQGDQAKSDLFYGIVRSEDFKQAINSTADFTPFSRPEWWDEVGSEQSEQSSAETSEGAQASPAETNAADQDTSSESNEAADDEASTDSAAAA